MQMQTWKVAYLKRRRMVLIPLAKAGGLDWRQMLSEYALVGGEIEIVAQRAGEGARLFHLPVHEAVDARQQERQRLAEVPQDDLQARKGVEDVAQDQPGRDRGGFRGEAVPDTI